MLVKIKHIIEPNKEASDKLFTEMMSVLTATYSTVEEQAIAVAPIKEKFDKFLCDLAKESYKKGKKMYDADIKDDKMYSISS